jgi:serine/threonine-protein kinase
MTKICPVCDRVYEDEHIFCAADGTTLLSQGSTDELIGTVVDDRYVIESMLGEGGMGRVYHGRHVHLPREVAIKVLHARLSGDPAAVARFNREAASASRIENPFVARVFDFGRMAGGATYLAMEFIPGRTLTQLLEDEGPLPLPRVVHLIDQVANGLGAAHALGIVHRDLKPDNVIVMHDADGAERAKIVDFGIAKATGDNADSTLTSAGFITGTPEYMSPEQFLGQTLDQRSDVFALGLLSFKLLTGALPFPSPSPERGFGAILTDAPSTLSEVAPAGRWGSALQQAFDRVLARHPHDRFSTASDFADALHHALLRADDAPVENRQALSGAVVIQSGVARPDDVRVSQAATQKVPQARPATRWLWPTVGVVAVIVAVALLRSRSSPASGDTAAQQTASLSGTASADSATRGASAQNPASGAGSTQAAGTTTQAASGGPNSNAGRAALGAGGTGQSSAVQAGTGPSGGTSGTSSPGASSAGASSQRARASGSSTQRPAGSASSTTSGNATGASAAGAAVEPLLDAVRDSLDALLFADEAPDAIPRARRLIARIDVLLPRSTIAGDSTRAYLLKANLQKLAGDRGSACRTLIEARPQATSAADRNSITRNLGLWSC